MSALLELAARCEVAAEAHRGLDHDILVATGQAQWRGCFLFWMNSAGSTNDLVGNAAPAYTASLDAALSLVPEGWQCDGLKWWAEHGASCMLVGSTWDGSDWVHRFDDGRESGVAYTPALAICAAALRARATLSSPDARPASPASASANSGHNTPVEMGRQGKGSTR